MIVRCGACRNQFDVPGEGRFSCPVCGSVNMVRSRPGSPGPAGTPPPGTMPPTGGPGLDGMATPPAPPPPPPPEVPATKTQCSSCGFSFIVGEISLATCPMCGAEVQTGLAESDPAQPVADSADNAAGDDGNDGDDATDDSSDG